MFTLCGSVFCGQDFFGGVQGNLTEEKGHREDHPDINHLDVGRGREGLRDSGKTETFVFVTHFHSIICVLLGCQCQQSCEVGLDHHVYVVVSERLADMSKNNDDDGRDEHRQDIPNEWSSKNENDSQS